jgi:hypothetical protein
MTYTEKVIMVIVLGGMGKSTLNHRGAEKKLLHLTIVLI